MNTDSSASASPTRLLRWMPVTFVAVLTLASWALFLSGGLRSIPGWIALQTLVPFVALVTLLVTAIVAAVRRRATIVLAVTAGLCVCAAWPAAWIVQKFTFAYPYSLRATSPGATVRLPLDGAVRVGWGGDDLAHNRHASMPDQRWAYDLTIEPAGTQSTRLEDYGCWGKNVVAPIAGEVWVAHDGEPEQTPGKLVVNYRAPLGNNVVLRLATGTFLVLGHLQRGSVVAREGARVVEGELLGRCGDSGNTSEPHVHIHHQRQDPRDYPVNFAEGLPLYFRDHDGAAMPLGGLAWDGKTVTMLGDVVHHIGGTQVARTLGR